jgi:hypothetical protein
LAVTLIRPILRRRASAATFTTSSRQFRTGSIRARRRGHPARGRAPVSIATTPRAGLRAVSEQPGPREHLSVSEFAGSRRSIVGGLARPRPASTRRGDGSGAPRSAVSGTAVCVPGAMMPSRSGGTRRCSCSCTGPGTADGAGTAPECCFDATATGCGRRRSRVSVTVPTWRRRRWT